MTPRMKVALYRGKGKIEISEIKIPHIINREDVLLRVKCCGICGSDLHVYLEKWPQPSFLTFSNEMINDLT